ncbi:hypothetical protein ABEB22_11665 [Thioclava sp. 'Guangxiensis']|uniref:hypothetical protein n=1 Tax=Thioclava sp. 'Guangxiensis' TaxID=3149044 RepID=UPI003877E76D
MYQSRIVAPGLGPDVLARARTGLETSCCDYVPQSVSDHGRAMKFIDTHKSRILQTDAQVRPMRSRITAELDRIKAANGY